MSVWLSAKPFWRVVAMAQAQRHGGAIVRMAVSQAFLAVVAMARAQRNRMRKEKPITVPWKESVAQWAERAQKVVEWMNERDGLDRLCRRFPERVQQCYDVAGERLPR